MSRYIIFVVAMLVCIFSVFGSANAIPIDTFNDTSQSIFTNAGTVPVDNFGDTTAPEALGGDRTLEISDVTGPSLTTLEVIDVNAFGNNTGTGFLALSNNSGTSSESMVTWDSAESGLGGVDLTVDDANAIGLQLLSIDQGVDSLTLTIQIETDGVFANLDINNPIVGLNVYNFNTFENAGNVNFASVDSIKLFINPTFAIRG